MDKTLFNTIRRALHRDSRNSISDQKLDEAFRSFMGLEIDNAPPLFSRSSQLISFFERFIGENLYICVYRWEYQTTENIGET
jgi:hypothetical protein